MYTITINRTLAFDISHSYKLGQILLMILLRTVLLILVQVLLEKPSLPGPVLPGWYDLRDLVYQLRPGRQCTVCGSSGTYHHSWPTHYALARTGILTTRTK